MFSKSSILSGLLLIGAIAVCAIWLRVARPGLDLAERRSAIVYRPVAMGAVAPPLRLVGAWEIAVGDPRFGGVSGLGVDHGRLLALTDSGMLAWLDPPDRLRPMATIRALPAVGGDPTRKIGRDSEALLRDEGGSDWWVAFEQIHVLIRYDAAFRRALERVPVVGPRFLPNEGVEALSSDGGMVTWIAESSGVSDATRLPDGRQLMLERRTTLTGLTARLLGLGRPIDLPLGPFDNAEAMTAAPLANGGTRLWIMTDNDFSASRRTLLVAVDLKADHQ